MSLFRRKRRAADRPPSAADLVARAAAADERAATEGRDQRRDRSSTRAGADTAAGRSPSAAPPPPEVGVLGGDDPNPSSQVLVELKSFFAGRPAEAPQPGGRPAPPGPIATGSGGEAASVGASAEPSVAAPPPSDERASTTPTSSTATRAMEQHPGELEPAPTRHALRRSRREARREAKAERKRLAAHDKAVGAKNSKPTESAASSTPPATPPAPPVAPSAAVESSSTRSPGPTAAETIADRQDLSTTPEVEGVRIVRRAGIEAASTPDQVDAATSAPSPPIGEPSLPGAPVPTDGDTAPLGDAGAVDSVPAATSSSTTTTGADEAARRVTIIDTDDLPDPVYLDPETGQPAESEAARVFIDDQAAHPGGEFLPIDLATSAGRIEPRLRERRAAVKKESRRKRLKWVGAGAAVVGLAASVLVVLGSSLFAVDSVRVEGVAYSAGPEFDAVLDELVGSNVLRVDSDALAEELERIPWVDAARVTADFPNSATIEVRERTPVVAYLGADNRYRVLDGKGRVLTVLDGRPTEYLEVFVDNPTNLNPGAVAPRGYIAAATLATMIDPLGSSVVSIAATENGSNLEMTLQTTGADGQPHQIVVRMGAAQDLEAKLTRLLAKLEELGPEAGTITSIDVSTRSNIIS